MVSHKLPPDHQLWERGKVHGFSFARIGTSWWHSAFLLYALATVGSPSCWSQIQHIQPGSLQKWQSKFTEPPNASFISISYYDISHVFILFKQQHARSECAQKFWANSFGLVETNPLNYTDCLQFYPFLMLQTALSLSIPILLIESRRFLTTKQPLAMVSGMCFILGEWIIPRGLIQYQ